ncbi:MAG: hypothetical protein WD894_16590 [Pirellulales bacterium]
MTRTFRFLLVAATALAMSEQLAVAQKVEAPSDTRQIGRYQLFAGPDRQIFVIDTSTGQCWSRISRGRWQDEGNPTRAKQRKEQRSADEAAPSLELASKSVEMSVLQREERAIPGSDGSVRIRLGDITEGQVFLSVLAEDDEPLVERTSLSQGDSVEFSVGRKTYTVRLTDLRNVLIGDDFARITVAEAEPRSAAEKTRSKSNDRGQNQDDHSHDK